MKSDLRLLAVAATLIGACQSTPPVRPVVQRPLPSRSRRRSAAWKSLKPGPEHRPGPKGMKTRRLLSRWGGGSTVREVMFPGTAHEMTKHVPHGRPEDRLHALLRHGESAAHDRAPSPHWTPRARATNRSASNRYVSNLRSPDESYMGEMAHLQGCQHGRTARWKSFKGDHLETS